LKKRFDAIILSMRNKKLIIFFSILCAVTLLVVFNSVLFSVRHVRVYCANVESSAFADKVLASHHIKRSESIFFVNKQKVAARVESSVPGVRVLNIEKKFPNRIYINYVEVKPYLRIFDGHNTYFCGNDLRVMYAEEGAKNLWSGAESDPYWSGIPAEKRHVINLLYKGDLKSTAVGSIVSFSDSTTAAIVTGVFSALERLGYYESVMELFTEIDVSGKDKPFIMLTTFSGMKWEIVSADNLAEKLRLGLSVFLSDKLSDAQKQTGTLVIGGNTASYRGSDGSLKPLD
ncbi:MAG: FtsQ-type POTRA domain-containing protein, partial [Clostridiales bacterium]|nr:FtsQ-type POTRA domain-containing protein [Clostridiales bacterium]